MDLVDLRQQLSTSEVTLLAGWATNASNLIHAKTMPLSRLDAFVNSGAGMSPVYNGYSLDASIQFTSYYSAVGDVRLRLVPESIRVVGDGLAIGATTAVEQDGSVDATAPRAICERVVSELAADGISARVGHELEFTLVTPTGELIDHPAWTPYGLGPVLDQQAFLTDLIMTAADAGIVFEQVHAEYGAQQIEVSLPPASPVEAADKTIVAKTVIGRVARRHGLAPSFSPVPVAGGVGNGAHQHLSLSRGDQSLFAGADGPAGLTEEGGRAIAGILAGLQQAQAVLAGSVLSGVRLAPGFWSGASICWGTENREASVRFLAGGDSNPHGANAEVKIVDPSANPYLATAVILGLAHRGIRDAAPLPEQTTIDPSSLSGFDLLSQDHALTLDRFEKSSLMRDILGPEAVAALLAVRRHEQEVYGSAPIEETARALRLSWTI